MGNNHSNLRIRSSLPRIFRLNKKKRQRSSLNDRWAQLFFDDETTLRPSDTDNSDQTLSGYSRSVLEKCQKYEDYPSTVLRVGGVDTEPYEVNVNELAKRIVVSGLESKTKSSEKFVLSDEEIVEVCRQVSDAFLAQPTGIVLRGGVKVVADLNGQFESLVRIFEIGEFPPMGSYVFLGNYIGLGPRSLETIMLLFCWKIRYPENIFLLRGNQECEGMALANGFYAECKTRGCMPHVYRSFMPVFDCMPLAALIANKILCIHSGISSDLKSFNDFNNIQRPRPVPNTGTVYNLLWGEPDEGQPEQLVYREHLPRFNRTGLEIFLQNMDADILVRGHEGVFDGSEFLFRRQLLTLSSVPSYDNFKYQGAILVVDEDGDCTFENIKSMPKKKLEKTVQRLQRMFAKLERVKPNITQM